ncbi:MAG TPA: TM0106 family RecB-like putative nuclease [Polyangiaceae bacterium]|nr:TM0106 family RecB-like putative nuclease [Polyangiaceae bacterium]
MKADDSTPNRAGLLLAATDLSTFSDCRRATLLDREAAQGLTARAPYRDDPAMQLLRERGQQHEARYLELLRAKYAEAPFQVPCGVPKSLSDWQRGAALTWAAMKDGHRVIYQPPLCHGQWHGRADFIERVDHGPRELPSLLGTYHYRVLDTKLAQRPRSGAVLQLCVYSELLAKLQGRLPEHMILVSPPGARGDGAPRSVELRTEDFAAYFRHIRCRMEQFTQEGELEAVYPEVREHCDVCAWWSSCNERRRRDDHLSFVAGISRRDQRLLETAGVAKLEQLGKLELPLPARPKKLRAETLERLQQQARLQLEARVNGPRYEVIEPVLPGKGLAALPAPSAGDVFFDIESDRYAVDGTFVYLFGWVEGALDGGLRFERLWATNRGEERQNFERFVDRVTDRWREYPDMHVYHFASTEKAILGNLAGRYATREDEVDDLLRHGVLCDLLPVVKQALRAGVESYSLKDLEQFHGFRRETDLREAAAARRSFELARETLRNAELPGVVSTVEAYNREDCYSTRSLRDWLERLRAQLIAAGRAVERPSAIREPESEKLGAWLRRVAALRQQLLEGMPEDAENRTEGQRARQLLADVLDWHRRKEKPKWREYFRSRTLSAEGCFEESGPIGQLGPEQHLGAHKKSQAYEYSFPPQDYKIKVGDQVECPVTQQEIGEVIEIRREAHAIVVKRTKPLSQPPVALVEKPAHFSVGDLQDALAEIADSLAATGFGSDSPATGDEWGDPVVTFPSARALLLREPPKLSSGVALRLPGEEPAHAAVRVAPHLRQTVLAIQGPPGAGKSYTASRMILALLRRGKRVGITATSHKVIGNLLFKVQEAAEAERLEVFCLQKVSTQDEGLVHSHNKVTTKGGDSFLTERSKLRRQSEGIEPVLAGTPYFWATPAMRQSVDVLIVDEAGQFSLANALAVSVAADSLVLLGDPRQLAQPDQGSHPPGAGASALEHVLHGEQTLAETQGLFLEHTWRLPPAIVEFTSKHFYSGRLKAHPDCAAQSLEAPISLSRFAGSGIFFEPLEHEGNVSFCPEEADHIVSLIRDFMAGPTCWIDRRGHRHRIELRDILVVAPYNAQVQVIGEALARADLVNARVGTVDKFQGQEAPIVIYSMTTSSPEDAPRGIDFLFELERLNVATSRAQAVVIVIASSRLLDVECKTPEQMRLVNGLCGAVEIAHLQHPRQAAE